MGSWSGDRRVIRLGEDEWKQLCDLIKYEDLRMEDGLRKNLLFKVKSACKEHIQFRPKGIVVIGATQKHVACTRSNSD